MGRLCWHRLCLSEDTAEISLNDKNGQKSSLWLLPQLFKVFLLFVLFCLLVYFLSWYEGKMETACWRSSWDWPSPECWYSSAEIHTQRCWKSPQHCWRGQITSPDLLYTALPWEKSIPWSQYAFCLGKDFECSVVSLTGILSKHELQVRVNTKCSCAHHTSCLRVSCLWYKFIKVSEKLLNLKCQR